MGALEKMDKITRTLERMDRELEEAGEIILDSMEVRNFMIDSNQEQMMRGKNADDSEIEPEYTERTKAIKEKKGQIYNRVTLKDEGEFQGAIKARNANKKVELLSEDSKSEMLQKKYGERIFGLNDRNLAILRQEHLLPGFKLFLRKYIN